MNDAKAIANATRRYFRIIKVPHDQSTKAFLETCQSNSVHINNKDYTYYQQGGGPTIVLVHGLHSNLGSMVPIAKDLLENGFRVILFDAPAHGESAGTNTNPVQAREVIRKISSNLGEIYAIICHSLGGVWALSAWSSDFCAKTLISISSPSNHKFLVEKFVELNQLDSNIAEGLVQQLERRFGDTIWVEFSPSDIAKSLDIPGLIIHGKDDDFVHPIHAENLASSWSQSKLEMIDSIGHFDILESIKVRETITTYLEKFAVTQPVSLA